MAKGKKMLYTEQGFKELKDELERRTLVDREKIKNDIAVARSFGDLSENSEYDEARNAQAMNEARIQELQALIENAEIIDESTIDTKEISLGSTVVVQDLLSNLKITYDIVGSNEADPANFKISDQSKIGEGLIGKRANDEVEITTPNGSIVKLRVLEVTRK